MTRRFAVLLLLTGSASYLATQLSVDAFGLWAVLVTWPLSLLAGRYIGKQEARREMRGRKKKVQMSQEVKVHALHQIMESEMQAHGITRGVGNHDEEALMVGFVGLALSGVDQDDPVFANVPCPVDVVHMLSSQCGVCGESSMGLRLEGPLGEFLVVVFKANGGHYDRETNNQL